MASLSPRAATRVPQTRARVGEGWGEGYFSVTVVPTAPLTPPLESCRTLANSCRWQDGSISSTRAAGSLPLWERVAAKRRGEGCSGHDRTRQKHPSPPTLAHSASKRRVKRAMLRSCPWHASRCARGEVAHRVRGTAVPNRDQAYSIIKALQPDAHEFDRFVWVIQLHAPWYCRRRAYDSGRREGARDI